MYVSSYDETIRAAFDKALDEFTPDDKIKLVKKLADDVCVEVVDRVRDYIDDHLYPNIKEAVCSKAAEVAESMLRSALAGDDQAIRNLFGFNDWYMKHAYVGRLPTQWALIEAIAERNPELIASERIAQLTRENEILSREVDRLSKEAVRLRDYYQGR